MPTSVAIVGVEAQLHAEGAGQVAFVQAVDHVQAVIEGVELVAPVFAGEQFGERFLFQRRQLRVAVGVGGVDLAGQGLLFGRQQGLQALAVDTFQSAWAPLRLASRLASEALLRQASAW